jgi:hypothetical protein
MLAETSVRKEPHGVTSQKTAFFIVTAVKISNLTQHVTTKNVRLEFVIAVVKISCVLSDATPCRRPCLLPHSRNTLICLLYLRLRRRRRKFPPKRRLNFNRLHDIMSQKIEFCISKAISGRSQIMQNFRINLYLDAPTLKRQTP